MNRVHDGHRAVYSSITVANYFIIKGLRERIPLTPMRLLKLVYITHGWFLGNHGKPLIYDKIQCMALWARDPRALPSDQA